MFKYSNETCEPILNIYILRVFQWYKLILNSMSFNPCNHYLKIWESIKTSIPKVRVHLGMWGVHSFTLFYTPENTGSFLGFTLGPHLYFGHEPKVRV
jgi:hypothetical protein